MNNELMNRARELLARWEMVGDSKTADTIRDLMAEVERLTAERKRIYESGYSDGRNGTPCEAIRAQQRIEELTARAESAEARLRELASAEPVAWEQTYRDYFHISWLPLSAYAASLGWTELPLILRPEMPS